MAEFPSNEELESQRQNAEDILDLSSRLAASLRERKYLGKEITEEERLYFNISKQIQSLSLKLVSSVEKRNSLLTTSKELNKELEKLEKSRGELTTLSNKLLEKLNQDQLDYQDRIQKGEEKRISLKQQSILQDSIVDAIQTKILELEKKRLDPLEKGNKKLTQKLKLLREDFKTEHSLAIQLEKNIESTEKILVNDQKILDTTQQTLEAQRNTIQALEDEIVKVEQRIALEKQIHKNLGVTGAAYNIIHKSLKKIGFDSDLLDRIGYSLKESATQGRVGFKDLFNITKVGFKESLEDPIARTAIGLKLLHSGIKDLSKLFTIYKEYNSIFVETSRSLGRSTDEITNMVEQAIYSENKLGDNVYTAKQLTQALKEVNEELGLSLDVSSQTLDEFTAMTNQMNLSTDEASKINRLSVLTNSSLKETNSIIAKSIINTQKQLNVQINARQVFQEIGKLSSSILVKLQQNPKAIADAVSQAKALGTSLEQVDKIGESILNWESSIENELKAELLTGREINIERARAAALIGDQLALTQEITQQVGTLEEFQSMNVLAQQSLAQAFGLTKDELADMLIQQETFNRLGDVSGKTAQEQLEIAKQRGVSESESLMINLKQQAAAEKLAATWDSIKTTLVNLLDGPLGGLVNAMGFISRHSWIAYSALTAMAAISLTKLIGGLATMAVNLGIASVEAITLQGVLTLGAGLVAASVAIGATIAALTSAKKEATNLPKLAEGGIVPASPGGQAVIVGEGGKDEAIIPLNSPIASKMLNGGGISNKEILDKLDQLISVNKEHKNISQQGRIQVWNDQVVARESLRSTYMNNPIFFS